MWRRVFLVEGRVSVKGLRYDIVWFFLGISRKLLWLRFMEVGGEW